MTLFVQDADAYPRPGRDIFSALSEAKSLAAFPPCFGLEAPSKQDGVRGQSCVGLVAALRFGGRF